MTILENKKEYFRILDMKAIEIAEELLKNQDVSIKMLNVVNVLYESSKLDFLEDSSFDAAYHNPITSDFEFYLSRIFYHISEMRGLGWSVHLRRQKNNCAPDIRVDKDGIPLFIIEVKVKAGWMQEVFSDRRFKHDMDRFKNGADIPDPNDRVGRVSKQLDKYREKLNVPIENVYVVLASLANVHRKKYKDSNVDTYKDTFVKNTGLPKDNLVVLTKTLDKHLGNIMSVEEIEASNDFERIIDMILRNELI